MAKKRVFVSFDFDNDQALRNFVIGQSRNPRSPFEVVDNSLKEAAPERNWEDKARRAISRSEVVMVMLGPKTRSARGVLKEIKIARELNKKVVQIIGYTDGTQDWRIEGAGRVYRWDWDNLANILG